MQHIEIESIERSLPEIRERFQSASPFPHIILDNFLATQSCEGLLKDYLAAESGESWNQYHHYNERKEGLTAVDRFGAHSRAVVAELADPRFLKWLEQATGTDNLLWDPELDGGGFHRIGHGGYLNVHADFLAHPRHRNWSRRLNLLLYLNENWLPSYGGNLELWDPAMTEAKASVEPLFNRCVIFLTTADSYHGHPDPLTCPEGSFRRSLALYYFQAEDRNLRLKPTRYRARPGESLMKKILVEADYLALRVFSLGKRYLGLSDRHVSGILKIFRK